MAANIKTPPSKPSLQLHPSISLKLSRSNFRTWKRQVTSLLSRIQAIGHIDGTSSSQTPTIVQDGASVPNPNYTDWFTLDQLIIKLLLSAMTEADSLSFASYETARSLWVAIEAKYANTSRSHVMSIKNQLQRCTKGDKSITDYLFSVKSLADELAVIDKSLSDDDVTLYILNGLGTEYRDIAASIRTREHPFTFEELHRHLLSYDDYIHREALNAMLPAANFTHRRSKDDLFPMPSHGRGNSFSEPMQNNASPGHSPYNDIRPNKNHAGNRSCIRRIFMCSCITITFIFVSVLTLAFMLQPQYPILRVTSLSVSGFNTTSALTADWKLSVSVENPNTKFQGYILDFRIDLVDDDNKLAMSYVPNFVLDRHENKQMDVKTSSGFLVNHVYFQKWDLDKMHNEQKKGSIKLGVKVSFIAKFKSSSLGTRNIKMLAICEGLKVLFENNTTGVLDNDGNAVTCQLYKSSV